MSQALNAIIINGTKKKAGSYLTKKVSEMQNGQKNKNKKFNQIKTLVNQLKKNYVDHIVYIF